MVGLALLSGVRRGELFALRWQDVDLAARALHIREAVYEGTFGTPKTDWESVKRNTGVVVRFHDLRHTCVTRMLEGGVPLSVVASILGWSPATTARMAKRYGHIGQVAQRQAVAVLDRATRRPRRRRHSRPSAGVTAAGRRRTARAEGRT